MLHQTKPKQSSVVFKEGDKHFKYIAWDKMEARVTGMTTGRDLEEATKHAYLDMADRGFSFVEDMHVEPVL